MYLLKCERGFTLSRIFLACRFLVDITINFLKKIVNIDNVDANKHAWASLSGYEQ